jgi:hypothetical protein
MRAIGIYVLSVTAFVAAYISIKWFMTILVTL